jgi:nucleotide-binding universal stress UspA family protein
MLIPASLLDWRSKTAIVATEDEIQAEIQKEADALSAEGIESSVEMREVMLEGPAHAIAEIADGADADRIVAGTRGPSTLAGLLLGSVTQSSTRPVSGSISSSPQRTLGS